MLLLQLDQDVFKGTCVSQPVYSTPPPRPTFIHHPKSDWINCEWQHRLCILSSSVSSAGEMYSQMTNTRCCLDSAVSSAQDVHPFQSSISFSHSAAHSYHLFTIVMTKQYPNFVENIA